MSPFSGNAAQLISLYIPTSIQSLLYSYYTSIESTTGDPASVIENAFTTLTPPAWLDAVPTEYQSNIQALESAINSLRVAATGGVGASVTPTAPASSSESESSGSESGSRSTRATSTGSRENEGTPGLVPQKPPTPSFDWGPSSTSGVAVRTEVPIVIAGVVGFVGAVLAV